MMIPRVESRASSSSAGGQCNDDMASSGCSIGCVGGAARVGGQVLEVVDPSEDTGCGCSYLCRQFSQSVRIFFGRLGTHFRERGRMLSCLRPNQTDANRSADDSLDVPGEMSFDAVMQHANSLFFGEEIQAAVLKHQQEQKERME